MQLIFPGQAEQPQPAHNLWETPFSSISFYWIVEGPRRQYWQALDIRTNMLCIV